MRLFAPLLITVFLVVTTPAFADTHHPLDGKTFVGNLTDLADKKPMNDSFIFAKGKFRSSACDEFGFKASDYTAVAKNGATSFNATTHNDSGDTISWSGNLNGNKITGKAVRKTAAGETFQMAFEGTAPAQTKATKGKTK